MRRKKIHEAFSVCIPIKKLHEVRFRVLKFCYSALPSPKRLSLMLKFLVRRRRCCCLDRSPKIWRSTFFFACQTLVIEEAKLCLSSVCGLVCVVHSLE